RIKFTHAMTRFQVRWCRFAIAEFEPIVALAYLYELRLYFAEPGGWPAVCEEYQGIRGAVQRLVHDLAVRESRCRHDLRAMLQLLAQGFFAPEPPGPWVVAAGRFRSEILVPRLLVRELRELFSGADQLCTRAHEPTLHEVNTQRLKFADWRCCVMVSE